MTKIYCADPSCEYCNDKGICTAKKVSFSWHSVMTLWEGRQEFNRCKTYQPSKEYQEMQEKIKPFMEGTNHGKV